MSKAEGVKKPVSKTTGKAKIEREPRKPESRKYSLKYKLRRKENVAKAVRKHKRVHSQLKSKMVQRARKYLAEYRRAEKTEVKLNREAEKHGSYYVPPEPKYAYVVRIRGINGIAPKPRKATLNMLRLIDPYVMWGYPSVATVRRMIYKRGFLKFGGRREPLDNEIIQKKLGRYNIICVEDLIHEIVTCGPHFKQATRSLWHFKLNNPKGGFRKKGRHFVEGGDFGNREKLINKILAKMI